MQRKLYVTYLPIFSLATSCSLQRVRYSEFPTPFSLFYVCYTCFRYFVFFILYLVHQFRYSLFVTFRYSQFTLSFSLFCVCYIVFVILFSLLCICYIVFHRNVFSLFSLLYGCYNVFVILCSLRHVRHSVRYAVFTTKRVYFKRGFPLRLQ